MQHCYYVRPHVTDLLLPAPSTGCGRPARFMLPMLISAVGTIPTIDEVNVLSACVMRTMALCRYASLPFAVCKMRSACEC